MANFCHTCLGASGPVLPIGGTVIAAMHGFTKIKPLMTEMACLSCIAHINYFHAFKERCENSNRFLHQLFQTNSIPTEPPNAHPVEEVVINESDSDDQRNPIAALQRSTTDIMMENDQRNPIAALQRSTKDIMMENDQQNPIAALQRSTTDIMMENDQQNPIAALQRTTTDIMMENDLRNPITALQRCTKDIMTENDTEQLVIESENLLQIASAFAEREKESSDVIDESTKTDIMEPKTAEMDPALRFLCDHCGAGFACYTTFFIHKKACVWPVILKKRSVRKECNTHKNPSQLFANQCRICKRVCQTGSILMSHMRVHTGEKPFPCKICDRSFSQKGNLNQHLLRHSKVKDFNCIDCGRRFYTNYELMVHKRNHTGERPFQCETCKICFTTFGALQKHKRAHTGERPSGSARNLSPDRVTSFNIEPAQPNNN